MVKIRVILLLTIFVFLSLSIQAYESVSLSVNIISHSLQNGAGKEVDVSILKTELEKLGHRVHLFDYYEVNHIDRADINLFLAQFKSNWFSKAKLNWFIPNAEFCDATLGDLQKFDLILCKTEECFRIFKSIAKEVYYLGFTSLDRYDPSISKDFSKYLHLAGKSKMKGTNQILKAWKEHPELPKLTLIQHSNEKHKLFPRPYRPKNIEFVNKRITIENLLLGQNKCGVHLCPSKTEGFGHYIMEAMSTCAVVVTIDAPPMNEFILDPRCLVNYKTTGKKKYAVTYVVDEKNLADTVKRLQKLPDEELRLIGERNREEYLRRRAEFKLNFESLMNRTVRDLYGNH